MIRSQLIGGQRVYNPSRKPVVFDYPLNTTNIDPALRKLKHVMIKPTPENCEYSFWNSSVAQSFGIITAATIIGDGLRIRSKNDEAKSLVEDFFLNINVRRHSIEDYITHTWLDELCHAGSYFRVDVDKKYDYNIDIQRLDPRSLRRVEDKHYGWQLFLQKVPRYKTYRSKTQFYRNAGNDEASLQTQIGWKDVEIPDEPNRLLRTNMFIRPPIASAVHYIAYKRWIVWFMRKYSQKHWAPFLIAMVGDPMTNYFPDGPIEMEQALSNVQELLPKIQNFGGVALPGDTSIKALDTGTAKSSEIYTNYINTLDKQIMMSIFASMGLREASGIEKSTQAQLRNMFLQFLKGIRRKYEITLERFIVEALCPANNISVSYDEIDLDWSPLKMEGSLDLMKAVQIGSQIGMFETRDELRKAGQVVWNWLDPLNSNEAIDFDLAQMKGVSLNDQSINQFKTGSQVSEPNG